MKIYSIIVLLCISIISASAQTTPYTPRQTGAVAAVKARAAGDGYTSPELTGIATMKGSFPVSFFTLSNEFDMGNEGGNDEDKGKANFWGYLVRSAAKPDSARAYIVVQLLGFYQVFDAPAGIDKETLPGNFSLSLPMNGDGSPAWMDTDEMVDKLRANTIFSQFIQQRPDSTPDYVALGMSKLPTPEFPAGSPLWNITFLGTGGSLSDFLSCSIHALDGRVECIQSAVSVEEENSFKSGFALAPNPAQTSVVVSIPAEFYLPAGVIEMYNALGEKVYSFAMSGAGEGYNVVIPVEKYSAGMYFVRYTAGVKIFTRSLIIE